MTPLLLVLMLLVSGCIRKNSQLEYELGYRHGYEKAERTCEMLRWSK